MRTLVRISLLPLLAACGSDATARVAAAPRDLHVDVGVLPGSGSVLTLNDIRIEVEAGVTIRLPDSFAFEMTTGDGETAIGSHPGPELLVDGVVLDVVEGRLLVGSEDLGPVTTGSVVRVTTDGVTVADGDAAESRED